MIVPMERLARIEAQLEGIDLTLKNIHETLKEQNVRVRTLEIWQGRVAAIGAFLVLTIPLLWTLVLRIFGE